MIKVHSKMEITPESEGGWEVTLWVGEACDYSTPFRSILATIAELLGQDPKSDLQLPAFENNEDFILGSLRFENLMLKVYYEHALGYLSLMNERKDCLETVVRRLQPHVVIA